MSLHATRIGEHGEPIVFCHGLFGQGKNWTAIAKALQQSDGRHRYRSLLPDMPNHGRSPWTTELTYPVMADEVAATIRELEPGPVSLIGHSMGGKIAMQVALTHPELVQRLVVVDISPVRGHQVSGHFAEYIAAMRAIDLDHLERRADADQALRRAVPDATVRGFLLQNLRHDTDPAPGQHADRRVWHWQPNLALLGDRLDAIGDWPTHRESYDGPVLWIAGANSPYVQPEHADAMQRLFPRVLKVTIKGAGHWVHSEQPAAFVSAIRTFFNRA